MSKLKLLITGVLLVLCVGVVVLFFKNPETSGGFIKHTVPSGEFKFSYPNSFYLLADYINSYPEKPIIVNELERRELYVQIVEYDKLLATKEEACRESLKLNPGDKCDLSRPLTQEELLQEKAKLEKAKSGSEIMSSQEYMGGKIISVDDRNGLYSLYYSKRVGLYYVRLSAFTSKKNLIWLEAPLWGVTSLGSAEKDVRVKEFTKIIPTLKFSN